ncbi:MAG TPA: amino acid permease, partial [Coleofasciculaceae cyanobacterium]
MKRLIFGTPLASHRERHERLAVPIGLAVFASDALSSTAYATEEILIALFGAGLAVQFGLTQLQASALNGFLAIPVAATIIILMFIVVMSYREVIYAHPSGGGSYEVAKTKLGVLASQVAGAALLIDYVLTVSVSISSGVANIVSTGWLPQGHNMAFSVLLVFFIMVLNLRGLREAGKAFAIPAFFFIASMVALIGTGIFKVMTGQIPNHPEVAVVMQQVQTISPLVLTGVLLGAFSHGCAAMTGIEAVSNGVQAFKEPAESNAGKTMVYMGVILAAIFLGVTYLAFAIPGIKPQDIHDPNYQTVVSQIAAGVFSHGSIP